MAFCSMAGSIFSNSHLWPSLYVSMTWIGHILNLLRIVQWTTCLSRDINIAPEFLSMGTYLSTFVLHFNPSLHLSVNCSRRAQSSHRINHTRSLGIKCLVCTNITLKYCDINMPITIQVDASWQGIDATLLQDDLPVTFGSKTLMLVQQCCTNRVLNACLCVYVEWFHTYVLGCAFTVKSNNKPLKQIKLKNLADAPVHFQRMLFCLQNYDVTINYHPDKEILEGDAFFHFALPDSLGYLLTLQ